MDSPLSIHRPLHILVLGAGIAGLTCALALRKQGHSVTLLEKSRFSTYTETGAAVYVAPNASGHLLRLGWDPAKSGSNLCEGFVALDPQGEVKSEMDIREWNRQWKHPFYLAHRVDLHRELRRLATEEGVELVLGVRVASIDVERAVVREEGEDGRVWQGDVVVGADGNKSFARGLVEPGARLTVYGKSCYRWLVDIATLESDPETKPLVGGKGYFAQLAGPDRKVILYPCRDNTLMNIAAFVPASEAEDTDADWLSQGSKPYLLSAFSSFSPASRKLISYAGDDLKVWQMMDLEPLPRYNAGRLALIGDAAHPFLPFLGQGAAQAIEDGISIATLIGEGTRSEDVPELLRLYDETRRERAHFVQDATRRNGLDEGKERPPPSFLMEMFAFCFRHDEFENSSKKLEEWKQQRQKNGEPGFVGNGV